MPSSGKEVGIASKPRLTRILRMEAPSSGARMFVAFRSAKGCSFAERKTTFPKSDLHLDPETVGCPGEQCLGRPDPIPHNLVESWPARVLPDLAIGRGVWAARVTPALVGLGAHRCHRCHRCHGLRATSMRSIEPT